MEIKIYIADLDAYNNGELRGEWVTLPMDTDELSEIVNKYTDNGHHDYAIHDFEAPFEIGEAESPWSLNDLAEDLERVNEHEEVVELIFSNWVDRSDALAVLKTGEYRVYRGCFTMADVARTLLDEDGVLDNVSPTILRHFDYASYGKELEDEGSFLKGNGFYVEIFN